jgi:2,5-diamino-6-(ribosylamino)-4(3H)-pyrimidinone 5'-phosphate reductase
MENYRPRTILSAAITLDGKLATRIGDSELSSKIDKIRVHKLRSKVDAILVGKRTVEIDDPLLSVRRTKTKNPVRVILDSNGTINANCRILRTCSKIPTIIVVSKKACKKDVERLKKFPITVIVCGKDKVDIKKLLRILKEKKIKNLLIEGGGITNWSFLEANLIDEAIITISPYLLGGSDAPTLVDGNGFSTIAKSTKLKLKNITKMKNEIVLHYKIK